MKHLYGDTPRVENDKDSTEVSHSCHYIEDLDLKELLKDQIEFSKFLEKRNTELICRRDEFAAFLEKLITELTVKRGELIIYLEKLKRISSDAC